MAAEAGLPAAPRRTLSLFDACALIVGIVLAAGVFRAPVDCCHPGAEWSALSADRSASPFASEWLKIAALPASEIVVRGGMP
jgi:hypothetical protein